MCFQLPPQAMAMMGNQTPQVPQLGGQPDPTPPTMLPPQPMDGQSAIAAMMQPPVQQQGAMPQREMLS